MAAINIIIFLIVLLVIGLVITYFVKLPSDETRKKWAEDYIAKGMKTQTEIETAELQGNVSDTKPT